VNSHDPERAYVQSMLELADRKLDQARAEALAELDLYRDDFTSRNAEMQRAHRERLAAIRAETDQYIKSLYGEADEPAPTQDVGQQEPSRQDASPSRGPATPAGPRPAGQPIDPHTAELEEAARIKGLSMQAFADERQRLIRRPNQGMF
jgi:hypothetical protein